MWSEQANADHVLTAWLRAGGDFATVREASLRWIHLHATDDSASFLMKQVARQDIVPVQAVSDILAWCNAHEDDEDALWRLSQLGRKLHLPELAQQVVATACRVLEARLKLRPGEARLEKIVSWVLASLVHLSLGPAKPWIDRIDNVFMMWLRRLPTIPARGLQLVQSEMFVRRLADLLQKGQLNPVSERPAIRAFLAWVESWPSERRERLSSLIDEIEVLLEM